MGGGGGAGEGRGEAALMVVEKLLERENEAFCG